MKSPFKFLDSYTKDDREIFFGRDREIEELYHRMFESKIMLVYGISGTGKSSLIHCGLANKFQETDWLPIVVRRGGNINESLAAGIKAASITAQQSKFISPSDFRKGVRSLYLDHYKPAFFIFDQFEELFIFGDKEERRSFISIVKSLTESDLQCRMIFVMREEYMAGVTEFEKFIPTFFSNRVRIEKMSHRNALEAINQPCKKFNIDLEEGFAETMLEKLSPGNEDVELTYLQVYLDKIFKLSQAGGQTSLKSGPIRFTINLLNKTGDVSDLLGSFLDDQISLMENPATALSVLKSLVSVQGTKKQMTTEEILENLVSFGIKTEKPVLVEIIQNFVSLRIITEKDGNGKMEFRHDALAAKVYEKFTLAEKELLEVRKYIENAYYKYEKRNILLNKQDFEYLDEYLNKITLPQELSEYVRKSRDKLLSGKKAIRRITRITTLIFVLILLITLRFYLSTQQGTDLNEAFGSALVKSISDPLQGLSSELKLWELDSNSIQLHSIILKDFDRLLASGLDSSANLFRLKKYLEPETLESEVIKAQISPDKRFITGWMVNNRVFVYDIFRDSVHYINNDSEVAHIEVSHNSTLIGIIGINGIVNVCNIDGQRQFDLTVKLNELNNGNLIRFLTYGNYTLAAATGKNVDIYDNTGKIRSILSGHTENITSIDVTSDGKFLTTASDDKSCMVWNYDPDKDRFGIFDTLSGHKGKIWSCRFNKSGKYVLTASEDSTIRIWNLFGEQINPKFQFIISGTRYRLNNGEPDEDRLNLQYSKYYGKFCDATFSFDEHEIIAKGYSDTPILNLDADKSCYSVMFFDKSSGTKNLSGRISFLPESQKINYINKTFSEIITSPDCKRGAAVSKDDGIIFILAGPNIITTISGKNPMFSGNGNMIYWITGNKINKMPFHPVEIKRLLDEYKIASSEKSDEIDAVVI